MINPDALDLIQNLFGNANSEKSKRAEVSYNRARGLGEGEDYLRAHGLFTRRLKTEADYEQLSDLRARINRMNNSGPQDVSLDDLTRIDLALDALSKRTGRSFGIKSDVRDGRVKSVDTSGVDVDELEELAKRTYREHALVGQEIEESISPQQASRLGYGYRLMGEKERQQAMRTAPTADLIRGMVKSGNQEQLNRVLESAGQKAPGGFARSARRWSGGDEGDLYQEAAEKIVGEEQDLFRKKLEEVALEKARERSQEVEAEYKKRAEEQGELLSKWRGDEDAYLSDLRNLREKGFLGAEEVSSYATGRQAILDDPTKAQRLASDVITAKAQDQGPETTFGYPVEPDQGEAVPSGLGAAVGAAGKAGSLLGDSRAGQFASRLAGSGIGRALGPAALGFAGLSATADLTAMSGRTGAGSITNAATSTLPGIGGVVGSLGGPVGTAVGLGLGYGASKVVGGVMSPYADQVAFAKQTEALTGENLQGSGAQNNLLQALQVAIPFWSSEGAGGLRESQNRARLTNPFLDPSQIEALTTSLLELGASTEEAATKIEPLSRVVADFNLDPNLVAQLERAGSTGSLGGVATAEHVAAQIQAASGRGLTQQDVSGYVSQAVETMGPVSGYDTAPDTALAYSGLMSRGGEEVDMLFQNAQTVGSMIQSDAAVMADSGALMYMGLDPSMSPDQINPADMAAGRIDAAKQLGQIMPRAEDGKLSVVGRQQLQQVLSMPPYSTIFAGMSVDEVEEIMINPNLTASNARKEFDAQASARRKKEKQQSLAAKGIGGERMKVGDADTYSVGPMGAMRVGGSTAAYELYEKSSKQAKGVGAIGQLMAKNEKIDLANVRLSGGGTLAEAQDDPDLLRALNQGRRKLRVGGKNVTAADYNLAQIRGQAYLGEKGGLNLGERGKQEKEGFKAEIDLSDRASKYFEVRDIRNPQGAAGATSESQHNHAVHTGKARMNDRPYYGQG